MYLTKSARTVSLLIVGIGIAANGYSQSFLTNGLVAYYPFNGNPSQRALKFFSCSASGSSGASEARSALG
jgi:hypothetical protein